jgi:hypothetical protein
MYRIELAPGEEALFRNMDELAKGIHSGVIGPHARIWHGASNKWLPIDFHPHYKIAKERPAPLAAAPKPVVEPRAPQPVAAPAPAAPTPVAASRSRDLEFIEVEPPRAPKPSSFPNHVGSLVFLESPAPEAATPKHIEALVAIAAEAPVAPVRHEMEAAEVTIDISAPPSRFSRRTIGIAAAGLVATAGLTAMLMSRNPEPSAEPEMGVASTSLAATPNTSFEIAASTPASGIPVDVVPPAPSSAARAERAAADTGTPIIPAAPSLSGSRAPISISESSLTDVSNEALTELEGRLRASGLSNLFAPSRLASGQVGSTRLAAAGAANLVRDYRAKTTRKESAQNARAADGLLADIESILGILADNEGGYELEGNTVRFTDESLANTYGALRRRITAASGGSPNSAVASALVSVIGNTAPPAVARAD